VNIAELDEPRNAVAQKKLQAPRSNKGLILEVGPWSLDLGAFSYSATAKSMSRV
jgi:hypothetical protein